jgi:hypothetical protein
LFHNKSAGLKYHKTSTFKPVLTFFQSSFAITNGQQTVLPDLNHWINLKKTLEEFMTVEGYSESLQNMIDYCNQMVAGESMIRYDFFILKIVVLKECHNKARLMQ